MRIVYMGTPEFAVPTLERLIADGHHISLVVTREDKLVGRKQLLTPPPVKVCALSHGLRVFQPDSLKTPQTLSELREAAPEMIVVAAYGKILPKAVLTLPLYGCINVHASLLPAYRGAAPIPWAVINGEHTVGVTTMLMDEGLDTGDILLQTKRDLPDGMTAGELQTLLAQDGARLLADTLCAWQSGTLTPQKQPAGSSYAPMLSKADSPLCFEWDSSALCRRVCGLNPWPVASCTLDGKVLKIWRAEKGDPTSCEPGTICALDPLSVACGGGSSLRLTEIQAEGKQRMSADQFVRGHAVRIGQHLG